ncbi:MAG TPA: DUF5076 domain-containing protein [Pseudolabrys sp.]
MSLSFNALNAPPAALEKGGDEVLRAAVVEGALHVSLIRAFDDPGLWGVALADITRHVARIYATEHNIPERKVIDHIRMAFDGELDTPTDLGVTSAIS